MNKFFYFAISTMAILCLFSCASHKSLTDKSTNVHTSDTLTSVVIVNDGVGETTTSRDTTTIHITDSTTTTSTDSTTTTEHIEEKVTFNPDGSRTEERIIDRSSTSVSRQDLQSVKNLLEQQLHDYSHRLDSLASSMAITSEKHSTDSTNNDIQEEKQPAEVSWFDKFVLAIAKPFFSLALCILVIMAVWYLVRRKL